MLCAYVQSENVRDNTHGQLVLGGAPPGTRTQNEGGALCGALLPIAVFLVVKATGGPGLASWDRALAVLGRDEATCFPLSGLGSGSGGEGQLLAGSQHPGDGGPDVEVQRLEQQVDSHPWVADGWGATVGVVLVLEMRVQRLGHGAQRDHAIEGGVPSGCS